MGSNIATVGIINGSITGVKDEESRSLEIEAFE